MKLNTTTIGIPLAIVLLVGAAGAAMATSGDQAAPEAPLPAAASPTPTPRRARPSKPLRTDPVLPDVLDDLVTKGTITAPRSRQSSMPSRRSGQSGARLARRLARPPGRR